MWAGYSAGKLGKLYFFDDAQKKNLSQRKRQRKSTESLPPALRNIRLQTGVGGKLDFSLTLKSRREIGFSREKAGEETTEFGLRRDGTDTSETFAQRKFRKKSRMVFPDLSQFFDDDREEDEDTQRFLFEETKFLAPNILAQIEKLLNFLTSRKNTEREEIQSLNQEIQQVYGKTFDQDGKNDNVNEFLLNVPNDLYRRLLYDYNQLIANVVYTKREWQTAIYRDMASMSAIESRCATAVDSGVIQGSPQPVMSKAGGSNITQEAEEKEKISDKDKKKEETALSKPYVNAYTKDKLSSTGAGQQAESDSPPVISLRRESKAVVQSVPRPRTRAERFKYYGDKERGE